MLFICHRGGFMRIINLGPWVFYIEGKPGFDNHKVGKWMYFFKDYDKVSELCHRAVEEGVVLVAKHSNANDGVSCFYLECDDMERHKKVIQFFWDNDMIQKTKTGRLYNISFKLDDQTRAGEYGEDYNGTIKLEQFMNLQTGEWLE